MPKWNGLPCFTDFAVDGMAMVLQWLTSPVLWTLIALIMSGLGIYRELL
ncbi:hypothetical protein [Bradyrhizobium sp.]